MPRRGLRGREARAERKAAADAFGDGHDVGRDARPFVREELAGASHAGLDLVEDQQQPVLVAELAQACRNCGGGTRTPPSPWIGSIRIAPVSGVDRRLSAFEIAEGDLVEAFDLRSEAFEIFLLPAGGERRQRAAMKGAFEGDDAEALRRPLTYW